MSLTERDNLHKLQWQCRRGMLELDLVFKDFLDHHYAALDEASKQQFIELLTYSDQDLQQWLFHKTSPANKQLLNIIQKINPT